MKIDLQQGVDMKGVLSFLNTWVGRARSTIANFHWREAIIHPLVLAVFPILSLYVDNIGKGFLREALGIGAGVLASAAVLWLLLCLAIRDKRKSAIIVSTFLVLFFSYGHTISAFSAVLERLHLLDKVRFLLEGRHALSCWLVVWAGLLATVTIVVVTAKGDLRSVTNFLNIVGLGLVLMGGGRLIATAVRLQVPHRVDAASTEKVVTSDSVQTERITDFRQFCPLVTRGYSEARVREEAVAEEFVASWEESLPTGGGLSGASPDVYYIILDMYARGDVLEEYYDYDNSDFLSFLTDKGFYVADQSRANYQHTLQSLASSLNLTYLDAVAQQIGEDCTNIRPLTVMVKNSRVMQYLDDHGYTTIGFFTGHEFTDNKDVDIYLKPDWWHPSQFQTGLIDLTPFAVFKRTRDDFHRSLVLHIFEHLPDATQLDAPTFVFAHILAPHPPYVFGPHGEPVESKKTHFSYEQDEFIAAYRDQVSHVNMRLKAVIKEILSRSPEPPIIIVQADHGAAYRNTTIQARFPILNAYYFPDQSYDALYADITPVNTFRVVFNEYFGTNYPLLEDRSYFVHHPYAYSDLTDELLSKE